MEVVLQAGRYAAGLVEGIIGIYEGESKEVELKFTHREADSFEMARMIDKVAILNVTCHEVRRLHTHTHTHTQHSHRGNQATAVWSDLRGAFAPSG